jgi:glycosyltransferase involved in cell wall biosynthesis
MNDSVVIVVPCYNESPRLDANAFLSLVEDDAVGLLFVDDGSRDDTGARLAALRGCRPNCIDVLSLERHGGKGDAVRRGMSKALQGGAPIVGYLDADLATPVDEASRLIEIVRTGTAHVVIGSRVALLGRTIERNPLRHYLGRVFASAASLALRLAVYDTQCGAKFFRRSHMLEAALAEPFLSRWIFDVELLGRLAIGAPGVPAMPMSQMVEEPLRVWRDVPGSKLRVEHLLRSVIDMARVAMDLRRRRLAVRRACTPR